MQTSKCITAPTIRFLITNQMMGYASEKIAACAAHLFARTGFWVAH